MVARWPRFNSNSGKCSDANVKKKKYTAVVRECGEKMKVSYLGTQAVEVSPSGASGAGQQNWWSTVWLLRDHRKEMEHIRMVVQPQIGKKDSELVFII